MIHLLPREIKVDKILHQSAEKAPGSTGSASSVNQISPVNQMGSWGQPVLVGEVVNHCHPTPHENIDLNLHSLQTRKLNILVLNFWVSLVLNIVFVLKNFKSMKT